MAEPKKNVAYDFHLSLIDSAVPGSFKANPTLAVGDFKVSTDGSAFADLSTLPVVSPAGSISVKVSLSAAEMNGDKIVVQGTDVAGAEWEDFVAFLDVPVATVDDLNPLVRLNSQMVAGKIDISLDDQTITVFDTDNTTVLAVLGMSVDGRNRTRIS